MSYPQNMANRRSFVLVLAMITISALMFAVWEFSFTVMQNYRIASNMVKEIQAISIARGVYRGGLAILQYDDAKEDGPHDTWRELMPPSLPIGEGSARLEIEAEDGKININHLIEDFDRKTINTTLESYLKGLFDIFHYDPNIVDAIVDFIDEDSNPFSGYGAERDYYENLPQKRAVKNGYLDVLTEMLMIKGITPTMFYGSIDTEADIPTEELQNDEKYDNLVFVIDDEEIVMSNALRDYLTVFGDLAKRKDGKSTSHGSININFVPILLLKAMDEDLTNYTLEKIIEYRRSYNFSADMLENMDQMMGDFGMDKEVYGYFFPNIAYRDGRPAILVAKSKFFRITSYGDVGPITRRVSAVVKRDENKSFRILYYAEY